MATDDRESIENVPAVKDTVYEENDLTDEFLKDYQPPLSTPKAVTLRISNTITIFTFILGVASLLFGLAILVLRIIDYVDEYGYIYSYNEMLMLGIEHDDFFVMFGLWISLVLVGYLSIKISYSYIGKLSIPPRIHVYILLIMSSWECLLLVNYAVDLSRNWHLNHHWLAPWALLEEMQYFGPPQFYSRGEYTSISVFTNWKLALMVLSIFLALALLVRKRFEVWHPSWRSLYKSRFFDILPKTIIFLSLLMLIFMVAHGWYYLVASWNALTWSYGSVIATLAALLIVSIYWSKLLLLEWQADLQRIPQFKSGCIALIVAGIFIFPASLYEVTKIEAMQVQNSLYVNEYYATIDENGHTWIMTQEYIFDANLGWGNYNPYTEKFTGILHFDSQTKEITRIPWDWKELVGKGKIVDIWWENNTLNIFKMYKVGENLTFNWWGLDNDFIIKYNTSTASNQSTPTWYELVRDNNGTRFYWASVISEDGSWVNKTLKRYESVYTHLNETFSLNRLDFKTNHRMDVTTIYFDERKSNITRKMEGITKVTVLRENSRFHWLEVKGPKTIQKENNPSYDEEELFNLTYRQFDINGTELSNKPLGFVVAQDPVDSAKVSLLLSNDNKLYLLASSYRRDAYTGTSIDDGNYDGSIGEYRRYVFSYEALDTIENNRVLQNKLTEVLPWRQTMVVNSGHTAIDSERSTLYIDENGTLQHDIITLFYKKSPDSLYWTRSMYPLVKDDLQSIEYIQVQYELPDAILDRPAYFATYYQLHYNKRTGAVTTIQLTPIYEPYDSNPADMVLWLIMGHILGTGIVAIPLARKVIRNRNATAGQ